MPHAGGYICKRTDKTVQAGVTTVVAPADPRRVYLAFLVGTAATFHLSPTIQGTWTAFWQNQAVGAPVEFWFRRHGDLVLSEWTAFAAGGGTLGVIEVVENV